ncbi:hypothetical protein [Planococcus sp. ISL-109]|uniref:hypothetical protein n=1 Tax=Planococcus sp. ISL-109 TaxID=2819166 RepID=UPI001BECB1AA|nr:hypothetical protein [Planococcus sp. ISL-109]MBT2581250.1 hypothetical protein [Planococcus sp. ISL-109]
MKKLASLLLVLVLSGCVQGDRYQFAGSGDNWDVLYIVDVAGQDNQQATGTIVYTGEDAAPETIIYSIESASGGTSGANVSTDEGSVNIGGGTCNGCAVVQGNEELDVEIKWDGQIETFGLTTAK